MRYEIRRGNKERCHPMIKFKSHEKNSESDNRP